MSYTVTMRNNATGEVRVTTHDINWDDSSVFWWTEGNFACDCNRHLEFERATGREPDMDEGPCGEGKYTCTHATLDDGTVIKLDEQAA